MLNFEMRARSTESVNQMQRKDSAAKAKNKSPVLAWGANGSHNLACDGTPRVTCCVQDLSHSHEISEQTHPAHVAEEQRSQGKKNQQATNQSPEPGFKVKLRHGNHEYCARSAGTVGL
jgi:hypothetical protein